MKIELKKISFYEKMSEETNCFRAEVYINGKNVGYAKNDGQGGCTWVYPDNQAGQKLVDEAEAYFKSLPPTKHTIGDSTVFLNPSLDGHIDELLEEHLRKKDEIKFKKKMEKDMLTGLLIGTATSYKKYTWGKFTIAAVLMHQNGKETLRNAIKKYSVDGNRVLNTNIPKELCDVL